MDSSDSPLVWHLLTSCRPALLLSLFYLHTCRCTSIGGAQTRDWVCGTVCTLTNWAHESYLRTTVIKEPWSYFAETGPKYTLHDQSIQKLKRPILSFIRNYVTCQLKLPFNDWRFTKVISVTCCQQQAHKASTLLKKQKPVKILKAVKRESKERLGRARNKKFLIDDNNNS